MEKKQERKKEEQGINREGNKKDRERNREKGAGNREKQGEIERDEPKGKEGRKKQERRKGSRTYERGGFILREKGVKIK